MANATLSIYRLVDFAIQKNLVEALDRDYAINRLLEIMHMDAPEAVEYAPEPAPESRFSDSDAERIVLPANADVSNHMQPRFSPSVPYLPCHSQ